MTQSRRFRATAAAVGVLAAMVSSTSAAKPQAPAQGSSIEALAEEAYTFAFPMLEQYRSMLNTVRNPSTGTVEAQRFNRFFHRQQLSDAASRLVIRPNNDTLYSVAWLDLRSEPVVIHTPAIASTRYWSIQLVDTYTHNPAIFGVRTGAKPDTPGTFLVAGPSWKGEGSGGIAPVVRVETDFVLALLRVAVYGPDDVQTVTRLQPEFTIAPLHLVSARPAPPAPATVDFPAFDQRQADGAGFIAYFNFLLSHVAPHPSERALIARWAPLGIGAGGPSAPTAAEAAAIARGVDAARAKMTRDTFGSQPSGSWFSASDAFGNRDRMQGRYLVRATAARTGLWGLDREEAVYMSTATDAAKNPLDGAQHAYTLHFDRNQLPAARAFWSLVVYGADGFFVANPIGRYSIGDRTPGVKFGGDGSLTLYIQEQAPGGEKDANWLPAPHGPFSLTLRLYYPINSERYIPPAPVPVR